MPNFCNENTDKATVNVIYPVKQKIQGKGIVTVEIEEKGFEYLIQNDKWYRVFISCYTRAGENTLNTYIDAYGYFGSPAVSSSGQTVSIERGIPAQNYSFAGSSSPGYFVSAAITSVADLDTGLSVNQKIKHRVVVSNLSGLIYASPYFDQIPKYTVGCEGCPPGYVKCETDSYPGYCCISCAEIIGRIDSVTNQLRDKKRG